MQNLRRKSTGTALGGALALILALGGMALAAAPAPDFTPFTMRITWYTGTAITRSSGPAQAGTAVSFLKYESIHNWMLTVVDSSWDPSAVSSTNGVDGSTQFTFLAQAQKLKKRVVPKDEPPMVPDRWLNPGLMNHIQQQGFVQTASSPAGTVTFVERDAKTHTNADGTVEVLDGTIVVFDTASSLPLRFETYGNSKLRESRKYEVVSRP